MKDDVQLVVTAEVADTESQKTAFMNMSTNIRLRLASPIDAAEIRAIYAPYCESSCVSFETVAPTVDQMQQRIEYITPQYPWLAAVVDGRLAGYVYASQHRERAAYRWAVEVAVYIAADQHRRGLGRALYSSLFSILRKQGYFKALAGVTLPNAGSVGLHESLGFRPVGVLRGIGHKSGRWHDVGWWQLDLQPETENPAEPRPFERIRHTAAVTAALADGERLVRQ
jgi:L-amino acid N-acyltransferase YncA